MFFHILNLIDFCFKILEKGHISGIAPTKMKMLSKYLRIKYVYCLYKNGYLELISERTFEKYPKMEN